MSDVKVKKDIEVLKYKRDNIVQKIEYLYSKANALTINAEPDDMSEFKVRCERLQAHHDSFERYQTDIAKSYVQLKETSENNPSAAKPNNTPSSDRNEDIKEMSSLPQPTSALTCTRPNIASNSKKDCFESTTVLLGTAVIRLQESTGNFQSARALVDAGSQSSFITEACAQRLGLPRRRHIQPILGLSETSVLSNKGIVLCVLKPSHQDTPILEANAIVLNRITSQRPSTTLHEKVRLFYQGWDLADPEFYLPSKIDFLIGADLFPQLFDGGRLDSPHGIPTAFHTIFGWLLIGETSVPVSQFQTVSANLALLDHESLEFNLKRFWEVEEPPMTKCLVSPEDDHCESIFTSTTERDSSGRFIVNLPFKNDSPDFGNSYNRAKNCLLSLEGKFKRNPEFQSAYSAFITEYETLGHMTKVTNPMKEAYYIPHHGIFKKNASASKLRVVFNASAPTTSGKSLNDELLIGPKLQTDICKILSLFRLHSYVFTTDIEKMYRQILVNPEHRTYQAILWRDNPENEISTYLLNTVSYGVCSSPFLALRTLRQLASERSEQYPLASDVVLNSTFVDDILTGGDSLEKTKKVKTELISLLESGGFQLRKWSSNSQELLQDVPSHHQELIFRDDKLENPSIKVLGLKWNPISDVFSYEVHVEQLPTTKRSLLSQVSKVYDPLGLITPVVLWAKCLIQKIWTLGLDWDQTLPTDIINQSVKYFENLPQLSRLNIPRPVLSPGNNEAQLHGFCDASEVGYGCAVYLRIVDNNGLVHSNLIMAKSKVAPLKKLSIPRLELCGAALLIKTMIYCHDIFNSKLGIIPAFAWTDSVVVLHWIRSPPHQLKTFVANRVAEIQSLIVPAKWRHTPTSSNPADYASRGLLPNEILDTSLWWQGPDWLQEDQSSWPTQPLPALSSEESLLEFRPNTSSVLVAAKQPTNHIIELIENSSDFRKLQSCFGWVLRFINNCQKSKEKTFLTYLSAAERTASLNSLVKTTQSHHFQDQIKKIYSQQTSPMFQRLDPFLDSNGILRVGGRLKNAQLGYDAKHPMLLPKNSPLTHLLIDYFHVKYLHIGPRTLQSLLSRQFWIISARHVIRHRISKCLVCTKFKANSPHPYMGNLPESRLKPIRPFLNVGVDFGGPFMTKTDRLRKPQILKSYVCLFVCFSTKAIHLELVSSLSTEAFLACLDRFVSRRGLCANIYSDQGTNFVGADRELQDLCNLLYKPPSSDVIQSKVANLGISWHFNPPAAPHFGGLWESGIKSTKHHLKRVIGNQIYTFEEFSTLLTKIEAILNSRPLCSLSPDPNEFQILTPGHFLIGEPLVALPQADFSTTPSNRLSRWQLIQQAQKSFWNTWSREYLHQLQQRYKWNLKQPNLKIDDLVLIKDKNLPPLKWTAARVIATHPGKDGIVRVVSLKTPTGQLQRPVVQLCPLPLE
ncbi:uncharacterized protein LOC128995865 [Macrosteles quadrilineatus]|uniref:uncharacterized protein LOC128995865 n=1 Tax=Macrosteles quadrilineatus TaxID=74068 RepID=UPI0023E26EEA|nr:uncharacterized protein LOC128995865 [Macrosteles quadrilineatus]